MSESIRDIDVGAIIQHPLNPRADAGDLADLVASIKAGGVRQPILVIENPAERGRSWLVVDGSRRLAASRAAKKATIPAIVRDMTEAEAAQTALVANLQRKDLNPLEHAAALKKTLEISGLSQAALGAQIGMAQSSIANALRLLDAPKPVKDAIASGAITAAHARIALTVPAEYVSGLPLKAGVTVNALEDAAKDLIHRAEVIGKIKALVAGAKGATWGGDFQIDERRNFKGGVYRATFKSILGEAPARILGEIAHVRNGSNYYTGDTAQHDKVCACRSVAPTVDTYRGGAVRLERVCTDSVGWRKYVGKRAAAQGRRAAGAARSPAQVAKDRAKKKAEAARVLANIMAGGGHYGGVTYAPAETEKILVGAGFTSDKAIRTLFLASRLERCSSAHEKLEVVRRTIAMSPARLKEAILRSGAREVNSRLVGRGSGEPFDVQLARHELLIAFGVKSKAPAPKVRKAKTSKKRAA